MKCKRCNGRGKVYYWTFPWAEKQKKYTCPECNGTGKVREGQG